MHPVSVYVSAAEAVCALGADMEACRRAIVSGGTALRPLREFPEGRGMRQELLAGWIADRLLLAGRRYGAASNLAVHVARAAVKAAGWGTQECAGAALWVGTSRGNFGEWVGAWKARRPMAVFHASNQLHSEVAAAVSIELGLRGPWQVLSNGCASGLDALGLAAEGLRLGRRRRALAVAVDLPLVEELLAAFEDTGALGRGGLNDPFSLESEGFLPGEGAAAVTLEVDCEAPWCKIGEYAVTSDAYDPVAAPADGGALCVALREAAVGERVVAICPHANGTTVGARAEMAAISQFLGKAVMPAGVLLKPYMGHTLGASGLLEAALIARFLKDGRLPPNIAGLSGGGLQLEVATVKVPQGSTVLKVSTAMGGHHAVLGLKSLEA
jgi:3-oxoacyl-(acyl-carrier-protein) synthase